MQAEIDSRLDALARQSLRARFHLRGRERALVELRGLRRSEGTLEVICRWIEREYVGPPA
jgi:hypothetical protein